MTCSWRSRKISYSWLINLTALHLRALCGSKLWCALTYPMLSTHSCFSRQTPVQGIGRLSGTLTPIYAVPWIMPLHTTEEVMRASSRLDISMQTTGKTAEYDGWHLATFLGWLEEWCSEAPSFRPLLHSRPLSQSTWLYPKQHNRLYGCTHFWGRLDSTNLSPLSSTATTPLLLHLLSQPRGTSKPSISTYDTTTSTNAWVIGRSPSNMSLLSTTLQMSLRRPLWKPYTSTTWRAWMDFELIWYDDTWGSVSVTKGAHHWFSFMDTFDAIPLFYIHHLVSSTWHCVPCLPTVQFFQSLTYTVNLILFTSVVIHINMSDLSILYVHRVECSTCGTLATPQLCEVRKMKWTVQYVIPKTNHCN